MLNKSIVILLFITSILAIQKRSSTAGSTNYVQSTETINGVTYSVITVTYSGPDAGPAVNDAIAAARNAAKPVILDFPTATYNFKSSSAINAEYYISNASTAAETPGGWRQIGLLFKDINDITIRGNGSTLLFHGIVTPLVFDHAVNVHMNDIRIDFKRPVMSEMKVAAIGSNYVDMDVHPDSLYKIVNNQLQWTGEVDSNDNAIDNWVAKGYANIESGQEGGQDYDPVTKKTWRIGGDFLKHATSAQDLGNRRVRFTFTSVPNLTVGHTYQLRNIARKEEGAFIYRSKNITWTGVAYYAIPGLGIVSQYSENLAFNHLNLAPKTGSGRTNVAMADFMHFSGCKGQITISNSNFFGAHDDPINVHGTHLRIVDKLASNQVKVQFMQPQSWGFDAFAVNDTIDFIKGYTLLPAGSAVVTDVTRLDDFNILLTLDRAVPSSVTINDYYVENATWTPNVTITGNTFESIPTRGILVTTRGNVLIDKNTFNGMMMSSILIADDADYWFESGMVRNVTISNNTFNNTANPVISIEPSAPSTNPEQTVHNNINIKRNKFYMTGGTTTIYAGSVKGFDFSNNLIQEGGLQINAKGSKNVNIAGNTFAQSGVTKGVALSYMYIDTDTIDPAQGFSVTRSNIVPNANENTAVANDSHGEESGEGVRQ